MEIDKEGSTWHTAQVSNVTLNFFTHLLAKKKALRWIPPFSGHHLQDSLRYKLSRKNPIVVVLLLERNRRRLIPFAK